MDKIEAIRNAMAGMSIEQRLEIINALYTETYGDLIKEQKEYGAKIERAQSILDKFPYVPKGFNNIKKEDQ